MPEPHRPGQTTRACLRRARSAMLLVALCLSSLVAQALEAGATPVRVAVLKFGTASWELETLRRNGFDRRQGIRVELLELAGKQATLVALQGGEVEMALTDWLWVSRQRAAGRDLSFIPFSTGAGSLVVPEDSPVRSLADLAGRRVGVAGGPLDKNWLLLRALALHDGLGDLAASVTPVFGAPPLLNQQLEQGRIDAVLNFWPYVARLRAKGMRVVLDARDVATRLGVTTPLPLVGYVFGGTWARANPGVIAAFQAALGEARALLAEDDAAWEPLRPLMAAPDAASFTALRDGFRQGIPGPIDAKARADAARLMELLVQIGGAELTGEARGLSPGTFWDSGGE